MFSSLKESNEAGGKPLGSPNLGNYSRRLKNLKGFVYLFESSAELCTPVLSLSSLHTKT